MDTDVAPDNRKPLAALSKISGRKVGEKEAATEKIDELSKPVPIIFFPGNAVGHEHGGKKTEDHSQSRKRNSETAFAGRKNKIFG